MAQTIQHVVVLMLENRGFDHMVGFLKATDPNIDGLTGTEWNPSNPLQPTDHVTVSPAAEFVLKPDPGHSVMDTNTQLFSNPNGPPSVGMPNAGFIWSYSQRNPPPPDATSIMKCFDPARLHGAHDAGARIRPLRRVVFLGAWADVAEPILCARRDVEGVHYQQPVQQL